MPETSSELMKTVMEEYKILWDYYKQTQLERRSIYEWYFKIVALPTTIISALAGIVNTASDLTQTFLAGFLIIVFLAGFTIFIAYVTESASSSKYYNDINNIRKEIVRKFGDDYQSFFNIDSTYERKARIFSVKFFKSLTVPILNSGIGVFALNCLYQINAICNVTAFAILGSIR